MMNFIGRPTLSTILIVDDQPINIKALSNLLKDEYRLIVANNAQRALDIASGDNKPDLILLDILMPEIDGLEVCRRLKSNDDTRNIPIIFVTSKNASEDEELGLETGAVDYISKPFVPAVVRARVRTHIKLKKLTDSYEMLAKIDGLTGIPNRYYYQEAFRSAWSDCLRNELFISALMVDIDYFKHYNDNYGHEAGDECLKLVARTLRDTVKKTYDIVARYGGEEFIVILPGTDSVGAMTVADNMLNTVRNLAFRHEFSYAAPYITVSIGCSTIKPSPDRNPESLVSYADKALYIAKNSGRNQAVMYEFTQNE